MNIYAANRAKNAWHSLSGNDRARTLASTYFAPSARGEDGSEDAEYKKKGVEALIHAAELRTFGSYWTHFVDSLPISRCRTIQATLQSRLLINLSGSILENASIALEHSCGVPIIPGSAVKGAARRYAIAKMQECEDAEQVEKLLDLFVRIFGCSQSDFQKDSDLALAIPENRLHEFAELYGPRQGQVYFMQAVPQNTVQLCAEVLTPHHKNYMSGDTPNPTDDELPTPCYFPAVEYGKDAIYSFTLYAPTATEILDTAEEWLTQALILFGIGAKGAAGYGYFEVADKSLQIFTPEQQEAILFISKKEKLHDMFSKFHKDKDKKPMNHWALLRAISLPEEDPACRLKDFRDFLDKKISDKKEEKARKKALEAMFQMAQNYNINLPDIP